jgi:uncharacterized protein (TIGR03437 family)
VDSSGNLFIAAAFLNNILRLDTGGRLTTVAGTGVQGRSGDGILGANTSLTDPEGIAVDGAGNVYIAETNNHLIRRIQMSTGLMTTVAGGGDSVGDGGQATDANIGLPTSVALDRAGNLYIPDTTSNRVRKVVLSTGIISTVAGSGTGGFSGDGGSATSANLFGPWGVATDNTGNLYIADRYNHRVRRVVLATGVISTVAGNGTPAFGGDGGLATNASLFQPSTVAVNGTGDLYIADTSNKRIRRVSGLTGIISTIAGNGTYTIGGDGGVATSAGVNSPSGVALDGSGNLYISDGVNIRRLVLSTGIISTIAGNGALSFGGDGGLATIANLDLPAGVALDAAGNLYIADGMNMRVRRVSLSTGVITTVAGGGVGGDSGPATNASLYLPRGVAVDSDGNFYVADYNRVWKVSASSGVISTIAGNGTGAGTGTGAFGGDGGQATNASLYMPVGIAVDAQRSVYIADSYNNRVRRVSATTGVISTVAGNGTPGFGGDGGQAVNAGLLHPQGIALDTAGNLYIADSENHRIRRVVLNTGIISTIAGNGIPSFTRDAGPATDVSVDNPLGIALDTSGTSLYIASLSGRIRRLVLTTGTISTIAGNGVEGFAGDGGPSINASLFSPEGLAVDGVGNVYIADWGSLRVRKLTAVAPTTIAASYASLSFDYMKGGGQPPAYFLTVSSSILSTGVAYTTSLGPGCGWFDFIQGSGTTKANDTGIHASLNTVIADTMQPGTYSCTITIAAPAASNSPLTIPVNLTVSVPTLLVNPNALAFSYPIPTPPPGSAPLSVGSTPRSGVTVTASLGSGCNWLALDQLTGTTPVSFHPSINITVAAALSAGTYPCTINLGATGASNAPSVIATLTVSTNPTGATPQITSLSPISVPVRDGDFDITVNGSGFTPDSTARWNGAQLRTKVISSVALTATIDAQYLLQPGSAAITVGQPAGQVSNAVAFVVTAPPPDAPVITSTNPLSLQVGSLNTQLTLTGQNFHQDSQVRFNGRALATTFVDSARLQAIIISELMAQPGRAAVVVANPPDRISLTYDIDILGELSANPPNLTFQATEGSTAVAEQVVEMFNSGSTTTFSVGLISDSWLAVTPTGGNFPALLQVLVNPKALSAGQYNSSIPILSGSSPVLQIPVKLVIQVGSPDSFEVDSPSLQLTVTGDPVQDSRAASIFSVKSSAQSTLTVQAKKKQDSSWLDVSPSSADVSPGQSAEFTVRILTQGFPVGGFPVGGALSATVVVSAGGVDKEVYVTVTKSSALGLFSSTAITLFTQPQKNSFDFRSTILYNAGPGVLDWAASAADSVITVDPTFDDRLLDPGGPPATITVQTGDAVVAPNAKTNSKMNLRLNGVPTSVPVLIQTVPTIPPRLEQAGVIVGAPGQGPQKVQIKHNETQPRSFRITKPDWLSVTYPGYPASAPTLTPGSGNAPAPTFELTLDLANPTQVTIGQQDTVFLTFDDILVNGAKHVLNLGVVVGGILTANSVPSAQLKPGAAASCSAKRFNAVFTSPANLFALTARLPVPIEVKIVDDCGAALQAGAATVVFSSGDPALALTWFPDGIWRGTWQPAASPDGLVSLKLTATGNPGSPVARALVFGNVTANKSMPLVVSGSVLNAASLQRSGDALVPGQIISIFGDSLAAAVVSTNGLPAVQLGGVQVYLGSTPIPLFFVSPTQINGVVPFTVPVGQNAQLILERDGVPSVPLAIVTVGARPGIFTSDQSGKGQGTITVASGGLANVNTPAARGDSVTIWCTGLGQVDSVVAVDTGAPTNPLARVTGKTSVLVGNSSAEVQFAGLAPGFSGLYQVNIRVPQSAPVGSAVLVTLTVDGADSNTVTMAIR